MHEIYEMLVEMTKQRISAEKETTLSEDTYRMISLVRDLHPWAFSK